MVDSYDLIAIGAGPAGESAAELASFFGHRSAIVEKNRPGGTVTTTGGAPTKTLREAALYASGFTDGDVYGLRMPAKLRSHRYEYAHLGQSAEVYGWSCFLRGSNAPIREEQSHFRHRRAR